MKKYSLLLLIIFISINFLTSVANAGENWLLINTGTKLLEEEKVPVSATLITSTLETYLLELTNSNTIIYVNENLLEEGMINFDPLMKVKDFSIAYGKMQELSARLEAGESWTKTLKLADLKEGDNYVTLSINNNKYITELNIYVVPADFIDSAEINSIRALSNTVGSNIIYQEIPVDSAVAQTETTAPVVTPTPIQTPTLPPPISSTPPPSPAPTQTAVLPPIENTSVAQDINYSKYLEQKLMIAGEEHKLSDFPGVIVFSKEETKVIVTFDQLDFQEYTTHPFTEIFMVLIAVDMRGNPNIPTPIYINNQEHIYTPGEQLLIYISK